MKIYKKVMAGICCLFTAFSLCACGGGGTNFESESVDLENDTLSGSLNTDFFTSSKSVTPFK